MGIWRTLGYVFAGVNIIAGFVLVGSGFAIMSQPQGNMQSGLKGMPSFGWLTQLGGFAFVYGGAGTIIFGILLIWALVKSGQIENIDRNTQIIAKWAQLQMKESGVDSDEEYDEDEEQKKLDADEKKVAELGKKLEKEKNPNGTELK